MAYFLWALDRFRSKVGHSVHICVIFYSLPTMLSSLLNVPQIGLFTMSEGRLRVLLSSHKSQETQPPNNQLANMDVSSVYTFFNIGYLSLSIFKLGQNKTEFILICVSGFIDWLRCQAAKLRMPCLLTWICVEMGSLKVLSQKAIFGFCWDTIWLVSRPTRWSIWNLIFGCLCRSSIFSNPSDREI